MQDKMIQDHYDDAVGLKIEKGKYPHVDLPIYRLEEDKELRQKNIWFYNKTGWRLDSNISFMPLYWLGNKKRDLVMNFQLYIFQ